MAVEGDVGDPGAGDGASLTDCREREQREGLVGSASISLPLFDGLFDEED